ncbi:hypothetical protein [Aquimarina algiphila]|uniref:hypothetical protein n=1 Tax=Aquimarina algiphila TaxID=2047982 RepID=UPI00232B38D1|nr:hypothetical protein [Aquimarina algiphila]
MRTTKKQFKILKHFFVCFLLLNLTITIVSCSDDSLLENEELNLLSSDKDEEPDPDNRRFNLLASDKIEEPDPDDRE